MPKLAVSQSGAPEAPRGTGQGHWTPGPWESFKGRSKTNPYFNIFAEQGYPGYGHSVAFTCAARPAQPLPQVGANARLIAAAPELYEALEVSTEMLQGIALAKANPPLSSPPNSTEAKPTTGTQGGTNESA